MPERRILCLWFPNWPIQRLVVSQPALRRQRVVLFKRDSRDGQRVVATSPLARREGVLPEMPLAEARSLLRRSAGGTADTCWVREHDPLADREALERLADHLEAFSPTVGLEALTESQQRQGRQPAAILMEVTGVAHLFGGEAGLWQQIQGSVQQLGYLPQLGLADTVGAAWAVARFGSRPGAAASSGGCLPVGDRRILESLPIAGLRLELDQVQTLAQLGIERVGQLWQLPRADLALRFGDPLLQRLDQLRGTMEEPVVARRPPAEWTAEQPLEYPTTDQETIEVILERLMGRLCQQLQTQQRGALEWKVVLRPTTGSLLTLTVAVFRPVNQLPEVLPLVQLQLEQTLLRERLKRQASATQKRAAGARRATLKLGIIEIQVQVSSHVLLAQQQRQLFEDQPRLDRQVLSHLINRLAGRLGNDRVLAPALRSGVQPEYAYELFPLVDAQRKRRRATPQRRRQLSHRAGRPLRIWRRARPLRVGWDDATSDLEVAPRSEVPEWLAALDDPSLPRQPVRASWGPERIETGWWRGPTVCRDYWRVELAGGQQWWIYHDRRRDLWWWQGAF